MARSVNGRNFLKSEIPLQFRADERSYKSAAGSIDVNDCVNVLLDQEVIDSLGIFVLAGVGTPKDDTDSNLES